MLFELFYLLLNIKTINKGLCLSNTIFKGTLKNDFSKLINRDSFCDSRSFKNWMLNKTYIYSGEICLNCMLLFLIIIIIHSVINNSVINYNILIMKLNLLFIINNYIFAAVELSKKRLYP